MNDGRNLDDGQELSSAAASVPMWVQSVLANGKVLEAMMVIRPLAIDLDVVSEDDGDGKLQTVSLDINGNWILLRVSSSHNDGEEGGLFDLEF
jgi:hypothetical protein